MSMFIHVDLFNGTGGLRKDEMALSGRIIEISMAAVWLFLKLM